METYTDALRRRDRFPAILDRREGKQYVRPDGNHRFAADVRNERPNIPAHEVFVSGMQTTVLAFGRTRGTACRTPRTSDSAKRST